MQKAGCPISAQLKAVADNLVRKSVWVLGGDGWATPIGAIAKFVASGKTQAKKNLGLMQMQYKNVYVAYVSMGTNPAATVKAFNGAENYNGPYPPSRRRVAKNAISKELLSPERQRALRGKVATGVRQPRGPLRAASPSLRDLPFELSLYGASQGELRSPQEALRDVRLMLGAWCLVPGAEYETKGAA